MPDFSPKEHIDINFLKVLMLVLSEIIKTLKTQETKISDRDWGGGGGRVDSLELPSVFLKRDKHNSKPESESCWLIFS